MLFEGLFGLVEVFVGFVAGDDDLEVGGGLEEFEVAHGVAGGDEGWLIFGFCEKVFGFSFLPRERIGWLI